MCQHPKAAWLTRPASFARCSLGDIQRIVQQAMRKMEESNEARPNRFRGHRVTGGGLCNGGPGCSTRPSKDTFQAFPGFSKRVFFVPFSKSDHSLNSLGLLGTNLLYSATNTTETRAPFDVPEAELMAGKPRPGPTGGCGGVATEGLACGRLPWFWTCPVFLTQSRFPGHRAGFQAKSPC